MEEITSSKSAHHSTRSKQEAKLGPEPDVISIPTVITPASSPRKSKKKSRRAPAHLSRQREEGDKSTSQEDATLVTQGSPLKGEVGQAGQNESPRKLELKQGRPAAGGPMSPSNVAGPSQFSSWTPAKLTRRGAAAATTTTTEAISAQPIATGQAGSPLLFLTRTEAATEVPPSNNDMGQKLEKRRGKKPAAIEAGQCEGHITDGTASSSTSDPAARRAMVVDMLSRMAGGPASAAGSGQQGSGSGHRDFSFLLPPPAENRKCRLCRNMFTDKSNVKQADGGAPCSFHPGK